MLAKFVAEARDDVCRVYGVVFPHGKWVKVDHLPKDHRAALAANPTFETKVEAVAKDA
ncbi:MAG: hypothetical protein ABI242_10860 [Caulobacteraceae bacterium]